jgi:GAF domain-containing protein
MSQASVGPQAAVDRQQRLSRTFVALADTLVADFDINDFLTMLAEETTELLDVAAVGVILRAHDGALRVAATSAHRAELLELFAVQTHDGPCIDCVESGQAVAVADLSTHRSRWPRFTAAAHECGYRSAYALPLRLRDDTVGALTLLNTAPGGVDDERTQLAQALADVATIGILQNRAVRHAGQLAEQLENALSSRVIIEQAKGILAERGRLGMDEAFARLRNHARRHGHRLTALATSVVDGDVNLDDVLRTPGRQGRG